MIDEFEVRLLCDDLAIAVFGEYPHFAGAPEFQSNYYFKPISDLGNRCVAYLVERGYVEKHPTENYFRVKDWNTATV